MVWLGASTVWWHTPKQGNSNTGVHVYLYMCAPTCAGQHSVLERKQHICIVSLEFVRLTIGQHITRGMTNTAVCANSFGREEGATHVYLVLGRGEVRGVSDGSEILVCTKKLWTNLVTTTIYSAGLRLSLKAKVQEQAQTYGFSQMWSKVKNDQAEGNLLHCLHAPPISPAIKRLKGRSQLLWSFCKTCSLKRKSQFSAQTAFPKVSPLSQFIDKFPL